MDTLFEEKQMKTLFMAGLLGSSLLATGALAQPSASSASQASPAPNAKEFMTQLSPGTMLLSDFMDQDVIGPDNDDIGDVEDVVLDHNGQVAAVVIEVEEGLGDRTVALPMSALRMSADAETTGAIQGSNQAAGSSNANMADDDMRLMLNMPLDQLKSAPEFDEDD
jgi:sporulation protein YlmC with PRC-barrel domain